MKSLVTLGLACSAWTAQVVAGQVPETAVAENTDAKSHNVTISISVTEMPLKLVLQKIATQARLTPVYGNLAKAMARPITMKIRDVAIAQAFEKALDGTGIKAIVVGDQVVFVPLEGSAQATEDGTIQGKVINGKTKAPLIGVMVLLDATRKGVVTDSRGVYRIASVAAGRHTLQTRVLGYPKSSQEVEVVAGKTVTVDISLLPNVSALDQVIVTGTVVPTERRAIPNAMTVISAKQLEERGITRLDQLFRGDVPGLYAQTPASNRALDEVIMYSRGATTANGFASQGTNLATNPIKTYVDGVEMADSKYLSQIDPKSIDHIEILTGPQASTIYGSNAINGVMQIFTKRGTSARPQLTLNLLSGFIENNFNKSLTPQHDYGAQLMGQSGQIAYSGGLSWARMGAWTPAKQGSRLNIFGGSTLSQSTPVGLVTVDASIRRGNTINQKRGTEDAGPIDLVQQGYYVDGILNDGSIDPRQTYQLNAQTLGFTVRFHPTSWWSHELVFGQDGEDTEIRQNGPRNANAGDTLLLYITDHSLRNSIRYSTTSRVPVTQYAQLTATAGIDGWKTVQTSFNAGPARLTGEVGDGFLTRNTGHNTGGFLQTQVALFDQLYLTYGLRAEWNPSFGDDANPNYAPRYGAAFTRNIGPVTAKLRMTYGRSTRPPPLDQKNALPASPIWDAESIRIYGSHDTRIANPDLGPESQQGGEGGIELYFGGRGSLTVTRYNQTVNGLIASIPGADSVRSLLPNPFFFGSPFFTCARIISFNLPTICSSQDADGYGYAWQTQNINAASIRNQGWEVQGSLVTGPLTTQGTYSWTKSRTIGVTDRYKSVVSSLTGTYPQYVAGQSFDFFPEHTWALGTSYARGGTFISVSARGSGKIRSTNNETFLRYLDGRVRLTNDRWRIDDIGSYVNFNEGGTQADLNASRRFGPNIEAILQIQNLTNYFAHDYGVTTASMGRQSRMGLRIRL